MMMLMIVERQSKHQGLVECITRIRKGINTHTHVTFDIQIRILNFKRFMSFPEEMSNKNDE